MVILSFTKILIVIFLILIAIAIALQNNYSKKKIRVAYPNTWGSLLPPLQHTLIASAIISNEFEALIQYGANGFFIPLACSSFEISSDFKIYKFYIDQNKKFSDGSQLTSYDFKKSLEEGLNLEKFSHNQSSLDGLYQLEGFENFKKQGSISGLIADDPQVLEFHYKQPFRQALQYLKGSRFAAYKRNSGGKAIGTGQWIITNPNDEKVLFLKPNPFSLTKKDYEIEIYQEKNFLDNLKQNKLDVAEIIFVNINDCPKLEQFNIKCFLGDDERHAVIHLNELPGKIFSKKQNRQALLFLIHQLLFDPKHSSDISNIINKADMQFLLPFQKGRLKDTDFHAYILNGEQHVKNLIDESIKNPIFLVAPRDLNVIINFLKSKGLKFTKESGVFPFSKVLNIGYKTHDADMLFVTMSVSSADPDGLYHALGKNGGITYPISYNQVIGDIVESARKLTKDKELIKAYELLNYALFEEAPIIHLGFLKQISLYRADNIKVLQPTVKRSEHRLDIYAPK